jgi:FkbM family methyltransferase
MRTMIRVARRAFYNADGPWLRRGLFERFGSRRYSRPGIQDMDLRLARHLEHPGTFVEAGAHDGYTQSATYYLERFCGWRGLLVEAAPELHAKAARRRPGSTVVHAALVGPEQDGTDVTLHFGDLTSTLGDPAHAENGLRNAGRRGYDVRVPGRTLSSILTETGVPRPDLIVLDIEGHELDALRGLDLDSHGPRLLLIEMLEMADQRPAFDVLLEGRYEFVEALTPDDALYRRRDDPARLSPS